MAFTFISSFYGAFPLIYSLYDSFALVSEVLLLWLFLVMEPFHWLVSNWVFWSASSPTFFSFWSFCFYWFLKGISSYWFFFLAFPLVELFLLLVFGSASSLIGSLYGPFPLIGPLYGPFLLIGSLYGPSPLIVSLYGPSPLIGSLYGPLPFIGSIYGPFPLICFLYGPL